MTADRIFALAGGAVLMVAGLLILIRVGTVIRTPARLYEATATFALHPSNGSADGLQMVWNLLPANAPVGLEPDGTDPGAYRLSFRSPDPAQAVAQANAFVTGMQTDAAHRGVGRLDIIHPADHPVEQVQSGNRQRAGDAILLLLAVLPIYFGLRLAFRHRPSVAPSIP